MTFLKIVISTLFVDVPLLGWGQEKKREDIIWESESRSEDKNEEEERKKEN